MSSGDSKFDDVPPSGALARLRALRTAHPEIDTRISMPHTFSSAFTIPYLGGISRDGKRVYFDRDLPTQLRTIPIHTLVALHEIVEWSVKPWAQAYEVRHHMATSAEDFFCTHLGHSPTAYRRALRPFYAPIEHEKIERVPDDLDLSPYDGKLKQYLTELQKGKLSKAVVDYGKGIASRNCGLCSMFRAPARCTLVAGPIAAGDVCDRFARAKTK